MKNNIVIGFVVVALVLAGVFSNSVVNVIERLVLAVENAIPLSGAGTEHYNRESFKEGFASGGKVSTTTTAATYTTERKDFNGTPTYWDILPNNSITISFSATSTHEYVPNVGDVANIYVRNASTSIGAITFAAEDSGVDLQYVEASGGDLILDTLDFAKLTFIRQSINLVTIIFDEMKEAD